MLPGSEKEVDPRAALCTRGWLRFAADPRLADWARGAWPAARAAIAAPRNAGWWRCGGTWFVGAGVLGNDAAGRAGASGALGGAAVEFLGAEYGAIPWDSGQISAVLPGYPRPTEGEGAAAFAYRRDRDAAHVDGLARVGPDRRRMLLEAHAFILGVPLSDHGAGAAPLVVWEGSPAVICRALAPLLKARAVRDWPEVDLTKAYHAARREVFATCKRVELPLRQGEAVVLHRLALHGTAPWATGARAPAQGRVIAYFRPLLPDPARWIAAG